MPSPDLTVHVNVTPGSGSYEVVSSNEPQTSSATLTLANTSSLTASISTMYSSISASLERIRLFESSFANG